jgi:thiamine biosynthesis protein ThiS
MNLRINGESKEIPGHPTLRELLVLLGFKDKPAAVEVNKQLVPRKQHESHPLREGDNIEIVTFVGGG